MNITYYFKIMNHWAVGMRIFIFETIMEEKKMVPRIASMLSVQEMTLPNMLPQLLLMLWTENMGTKEIWAFVELPLEDGGNWRFRPHSADWSQRCSEVPFIFSRTLLLQLSEHLSPICPMRRGVSRTHRVGDTHFSFMWSPSAGGKLILFLYLLRVFPDRLNYGTWTLRGQKEILLPCTTKT